jgi:uncharacterized membrane protein
MKLKTAQLISLFLLMLVTGVFWGTWFSLTRSLNDFSAAEFIHIGKTIIANVSIPMRIIFPACVFFMFLSLLWHHPKKSYGFYLIIVANVLIVITLLITILVEVPIDNQLKQWTASTVPAQWEGIRQRWKLFHTFRTFTSLASFAFFAMAICNPFKIDKSTTI